jgi:hypothetical protein
MKQKTPAHYEKAYKAFLRLRNTPAQAYRDFYLSHKQLELEKVFIRRQQAADFEHGAPSHVTFRRSNYFSRFSELFRTPRVRRATVAACTVMLAQQLCGINVLAFYSR